VRVLKKVFNFNYYSGVSDPVQYIRHFRDKMVIYSRNDPPMCLIFSSIRKDVALDWFYFLSSHSLHNFEELIEAFPHSVYLSWEAKRNTHNLLTVKMIRGDNLKSYIGYFQSQLAKVPNCGENISMLAFISEL